MNLNFVDESNLLLPTISRSYEVIDGYEYLSIARYQHTSTPLDL